jgi:hypothetical protein
MGRNEGKAKAGGGARIRFARLLVGILLLAALAGLFAYNVRHWFFLGDDCFISFRYARHMVEGQGLVWNPGERVEGYTNFLWVLLMAAAMALGGAPETVSVVLGVASGATLLGALLIFSAWQSERHDPFLWLAPFALASSRSFTAWCSGGLETMFFTLLLFLGVALHLRERKRETAWPLGSSLLLAAAALTRPEGNLFALVVGLFFVGEILLRRRRLRTGLIWAAPYAAIVGAHLLWRHAYYGQWLPNSFYAKVPGAWWDQGARYLALFADDYRILWFLPLSLVALAAGRRFAHLLFASLIGAYLLYVLYVGGDRFEFRFLVVVMPWFYWLVADGLRRVAALGSRRGAVRLAARGVAAGAALALLVTTHVGSRGAEAAGLRHGVASIEIIRDYAERRADSGKFLRDWIDRGLLPGDVLLCVGGAGALPYYTDWPTVDRRGINDLTVARTPIAGRGVIGHEREASYEYLLERRVVILDMFNRILFDENILAGRFRTRRYGPAEVPLKGFRLGQRYLVFGTLVSDAEIRERFGHLPPAP